MKNKIVLIPVLMLLSLSACTSFVEKNTPDYQEISETLSSVESAFNALKYGKSQEEPVFVGEFADIFNVYVASDKQSSSRPSLQYIDQPLLQFRYIKGMYTTIGNKFEFGTTYYDNLNGSDYLDLDTGKVDESKSSRNLCYYTMLVGMDLTLNSFGDIKADIGFTTEYVSNGVTFEIVKYTSMTIKYDYESENPSFVIKFVSETDETKAPYSGYYTYEYQYFKIENKTITEYRDFSIETSERLECKEDHDSFGCYVSDKIAYRVNAPKWFVNNAFYITKNMTITKQNTLGEKMFNLGLFAPLSGSLFALKISNNEDLKKTSTTATYRNLTSSLGEPVAIALASPLDSSVNYNNPENNPNYNENDITKNKPTALSILESDNVTRAYAHVIDDITFGELFTGFKDLESGESCQLNVWFSKKGQLLKYIAPEDIPSTLTINFGLDRKNINGERSGTYPTIQVSLTDKISDAYKYMYDHYDEYDFFRDFALVLVNDEFLVQGNIGLYYGGALNFTHENPPFPQELLDLGIPAYDGEKIKSFTLTEDNRIAWKLYELKVNYTTSNEVYDYFSKLESYGFKRLGEYNSRYVYKKALDTYNFLYVLFDYPYGSGTTYSMSVYKINHLSMENLSSNMPEEFALLGLPGYYGDFPKFETTKVVENASATGVKYYLYIYDTSYEESTNYLYNLAASGFSVSYNYNDSSVTCKQVYQQKYIMYIKVDRYFEGCQEALITGWLEDNPNYDPTLIEVHDMALVGTFNNWGQDPINSYHKFGEEYSGERWYCENIVLTQGSEFKVLVNGDWDITNKGNSYKGFGYNDFNDINDYYPFFSPGEDGKIVVLRTCLLSITAETTTKKVRFNITSVMQVNF